MLPPLRGWPEPFAVCCVSCERQCDFSGPKRNVDGHCHVFKFSTFTIWRCNTPVLMDDGLSVTSPMKKSRDVWKWLEALFQMFGAVSAPERKTWIAWDKLFSWISGLVKILEQEGMLESISCSPFVLQMGKQAWDRAGSRLLFLLFNFLEWSQPGHLETYTESKPFLWAPLTGRPTLTLSSQGSSCCRFDQESLFLARPSCALSKCKALFSEVALPLMAVGSWSPIPLGCLREA